MAALALFFVNHVRCPCQSQEVRILIANRGRYTAVAVVLFTSRAPHPALSFPGCSSWYVAEVQDSLCSLHIAQGRCPQGSDWIPVQRRGMWGSRGGWRSLSNAAGCSLAPRSAAWLQAARCSPDLQARLGNCSNPILKPGMEMWHSIPFSKHSQGVMLLFDTHLHRLPWSHGVLRVPTTFRCAGTAPHEEAREELHCEGREESKSFNKRGAKCAALPVPKPSQD